MQRAETFPREAETFPQEAETFMQHAERCMLHAETFLLHAGRCMQHAETFLLHAGRCVRVEARAGFFQAFFRPAPEIDTTPFRVRGFTDMFQLGALDAWKPRDEENRMGAAPFAAETSVWT